MGVIEFAVDEALDVSALGSMPGEVLAKRGKTEVTRRMLATLQPSAWLNDEVIDCYMQLMQEACGLSCWFVNTYFWPKLRDDGAGAVRRWAHRAGVSASGSELVVVPLHMHETHWALAALSIAGSPGARRASVHFYDSMAGHAPAGLVSSLRAWYEVACQFEGPPVAEDPPQWKSEVITERASLQENCFDCGAIVCAFAKQLSKGVPPASAGAISSSEKDIAVFRRHIVASLLSGIV